MNVNMHQREEDVSLMKKFYDKNADVGPGPKSPGYHTRKNFTGAGPRVNLPSLNNNVKHLFPPSFRGLSKNIISFQPMKTTEK